jgi:2-iminoacetate synthase
LRPVEHPSDRHGDGFLGPAPDTTFADVFARLPVARLLGVACEASPERVERAITTTPLERTLEDFAALLSPSAAERLEDLAQASRALTMARFGRTMRMYAPLYLSNECLTTCAYCGFARELPIARRTLTPEEAVREARHLLAQGFRSILLLTGEHERLTGVRFLEERIRPLAREVPQLSIEVQVWSEDEYRRLAAAGCEGVVIYQETYHPDTYGRVHLAGRKRHYQWRLLGPERAARAGMRRVGIGALFGLH